MKKSMMYAAMGFMLVGCAKNDVKEPKISPTDIITLSANATLSKAAIIGEGNMLSDPAGFKVYATSDGGSGWIENINGTNNHVYAGGRWRWAGADVKWTSGGYPLKFYAWYPAVPAGLDNITANGGAPELKFDFTVRDQVENQIDLMAGYASASEKPFDGILPITFDHVLSKVNFGIKAPAGWTVNVQSLELKNVAKKGTYDMITGLWSGNTSYNASYSYYSGTGEGKSFTGSGNLQPFYTDSHNKHLMLIPKDYAANNWDPTSGVPAGKTHIQMLYRVSNGNDIIGFANANKHPDYATHGAGITGPLFVKVAYPYYSRWEKGEGYINTVELPGLTGGYLIDLKYYDKNGARTNLTVSNELNTGDPINSYALKTKIIEENGSFRLMIRGEEVYLKGICSEWQTPQTAAIIANSGANAVRQFVWMHNYEENTHLSALNSVLQQGLYVQVYSTFLTGFSADYTETNKENWRKAYRNIAEQTKDMPNVFMIVIGNEWDYYAGTANTPATCQFINELALMVKSICPDKLVSTSICSNNTTTLNRIAQYIPALDVICFNDYDNVANIDNTVKDSQWKGAYIISEWGVNHYSTSPQPLFRDAYIEKTSEEKRAQLESRYSSVFKNKLPRCLGSFYFIGTIYDYVEYTPTWFNAFVFPNGALQGEAGLKPTPILEALQRNWTGIEPTQTAPVVTEIYINNTKRLLTSTTGNSINVNSGASFTCKVDATDREGDPMTYVWEILMDNGTRPSPPVYTQTTTVNTMTTSVTGTGNYRLYVYVLDGTGRAGTANIPFRVQ